MGWLAALAVVPACGDDGATATTVSDTDTDAGSSSSDSDPSTITITTADTSGSSSTTDEPTTTPPDTSSESAGPSSSEDDSGSSSEEGSTGPGPECGNDVLDRGEVCDGTDLGDATCTSEGFGPGELACAKDCGSFDTSGCAVVGGCGDGIIDEGEDCDGEDVAGETCESQGFDAGDLSCADDCTFDVSSCFEFSCGDGVINGNEQCDGDALPDDASCEDAGFGPGSIACTDNCQLDLTNCCGDGTIGDAEVCDGLLLGGATCGVVGEFDGGTLLCNATCQEFETTECTLCGDAVAQGDEVCDGADLNGQDCTTVPGGFLGGALACDDVCGFDTSGCNACGNDVVDAGEDCDGAAAITTTCVDLGHTGGALGCGAGCAFDETGCTDFPLPTATEIVITEIMQNPAAVDDANGEWFELHNPSLVSSFQLRGCVVEGGNVGESFTIDTDLQIDAGEYLTLATSEVPGFVPDFAWPGAFALNNSADTVRLVCGGVTVDEVIYDDGATFPDPTGASMQLDSAELTTLANDNGDNWCESTAPFASGDLGSPGAPNSSCQATDYTIDFCRLQFPTNVLDSEGSSVDVFGRVFVGGLTDLSGVNDPAVNVQMQVGYGADGSDPELGGWTWTTGGPNASYGPASPGYEANNDEYAATMTLPTPGAYDFAVRFTGDGGTTYTYCDGGDAGSSNGYAPADAGQLTSVMAGSPSVLYFSEYYEGTSNNKAIEIYNPSGDGVNLAACSVRIFANGAAAAGSTIPLVGMVDAETAFVLCHSSIVAQPFCDQGSGSLTFNGDDAVQLYCDDTSIDVFGQIGFDPGAEWTGGNPVVGTADEDVRRRCEVTQGDADGSNAFDPSIEWTSLPIIVANPQPEHTEDLGIYVCD